MAYLEGMRAKRPVELAELTAIEGVGPKTVRALYEGLGIRTLADLERAARQGKIRELAGFGVKSEQDILRGVEFLAKRRGRFLLGEVLPLVSEIESRLSALSGVRRAVVAGSIRRRKETVGDADLLVIAERSERVMNFFVGMPEVAHVHGQGPTKASVRLEMGMDVDLRVVGKESFGAALAYFTGSKDHNVHLRRIAQEKGWKLNEYGLFDASKHDRVVAGPTEKGVYQALGLAFVPPELREDKGEVEAAAAGSLPRLIDYHDLAGDLQVQTNWTDGQHSIEEMAHTAREHGLSYIAVTDHTKSLAMMGLDETRLAEQMRFIDGLNQRLTGFRVLKGAEVNVLKDGSLDIEDALLARLDVVGVGVHSHFHLSRAEMTARVTRAMRNPHVDVLFHPTGRILMKRDPYEIDIDELIRVARETGTILEIDAQPDRLDLKDEQVRKAVEAGVKLAIDTDAHARGHFALLPYGIAQARRGWARPRDVVNTLPVEKFLASLKGGGKRAGAQRSRP